MNLNKTLIFAYIIFVTTHAIGISKHYANNAANFKLEKISSNHILSNQKITCIYRDKQGFIWFGTSYGLFKFNGSDVTVYRNQKNDSSSIAFNDVIAIYEDTNNDICILGNYVWRYSKYNSKLDNFKQFKFNVTDSIYPLPIPKTKPNSKYLFSYGYLYGYNTVNKKYKLLNLKSQFDTLEIASFVEDKNGTLWIGSFSKGLIKYQSNENKLIPYPKKSSTLGSNARITTMFYDSDNYIWIGGLRNSYEVFDPKTETYLNTWTPGNDLDLNISVSGFCEDQNKNIWIATSNGISIINKSTRQFTTVKNNLANTLSLNNNISSIYNDNLGAIWIGTFDEGVEVCNADVPKFSGIPAINSSNIKLNRSFKTAYIDRHGYLWVGTDWGLNKLDANGKYLKTYASYTYFGEGGICAIYEDNAGMLWIGSWGGGLSMLNPKTESVKRYELLRNEKQNTNLSQVLNSNQFVGDNNVLCIVPDTNGLLWIGTVMGIVDVFNPRNNTFKHIDIKCQNIRSIAIDQKNNAVWCCTTDGLVKINKKTTEHTVYVASNMETNSLSYNYTTSIAIDIYGNLWITTLDGLNKFDVKKNKFYNYFEFKNTEFKNLFGLQIDSKGNLWFGCNSSLIKYNPESNKMWYYNVFDGLIPNIKYSCKLNTGQYVFGGSAGATLFYPDSIISNEQLPNLTINEFKLFNKPVKWHNNTILEKAISKTSSIELQYEHNVFGFDFSALCYNSQQKCHYAYMLEGFDKDWIYISDKRSVTFSSIPAGKYIFKVKASNNEGFWGNNQVAIQITIKPPFWETIWFRALMVIALIAGVITWVRIKTFTINRRNDRLERLVKIRTTHLQDANDELATQKEEIERMASMVHDADQKRIKFLINVSHEFRTPLTLILNPIESILSKIADNPEFKTMLQVIAKNTNSLLNLINQVLDLRKIEGNKMILSVAQHNLHGFLTDIYQSFEYLAQKQAINFSFNSNFSNNVLAWFDAPKIERVIINILSNAFKFTSEKDTIELKAELIEDANKVKILVIDTGVGIASDQLQLIFEPYYQAKNQKYGNVTGTGIGLNLAKEFIELHKGTIQVRSVLGQGSTFCIEFPVTLSSYTDNELLVTEIVKGVTIENIENENYETNTEIIGNAPINAPTILIVEDNNDLRLFVKQNLCTTYNIIEASNGAIGYELVCKHLPDLIISDIMMPQMNGLELCQKIKTDINVSHIPIILLTAITEEESELKGLGLGADDYLPKPFSLKILKARIENIIESRKKLRQKYCQNWVLKLAEQNIMSINDHFLTNCAKIIEKNIDKEYFGVQQLADNIGISRVSLLNKFKSLTKLSPSEFILSVRLKRAAELLKQRQANVSEIAYMVGFQTPSAFNKAFKKIFGTTPTQYNK